MNRECRTCNWRREGIAASDPFQCRRYPPTVDMTKGYPQTAWPLVNPHEWCGEWKEEERK